MNFKSVFEDMKIEQLEKFCRVYHISIPDFYEFMKTKIGILKYKTLIVNAIMDCLPELIGQEMGLHPELTDEAAAVKYLISYAESCDLENGPDYGK